MILFAVKTYILYIFVSGIKQPINATNMSNGTYKTLCNMSNFLNKDSELVIRL